MSAPPAIGPDYLTLPSGKFRPPFTFAPYARLAFSANEPPPTSDSSDAFFRRWLVIPFERTFKPGDPERDPHVLDKITTPAELSGLLNRALELLPDLRQRGEFTRTAATATAAARFRVDADAVAGFLAERCELADEGRVAKPKLYKAYQRWCEENGRRSMGAVRFHRRVRELVDDLDEVKVQGTETYIGLYLGDEW